LEGRLTTWASGTDGQHDAAHSAWLVVGSTSPQRLLSRLTYPGAVMQTILAAAELADFEFLVKILCDRYNLISDKDL
jgi:hypothetical protein